jgi:hypothetical protein
MRRIEICALFSAKVCKIFIHTKLAEKRDAANLLLVKRDERGKTSEVKRDT